MWSDIVSRLSIATPRFRAEATAVMVDDSINTTFTSGCRWCALFGPEPQNVRLTGVETESAGPRPFFNVDQAAFKSLNTTRCLSWRHVKIYLAVVCLLVQCQSVLGDHLTEFGSVEDEEQRSQAGALWHSVQDWLDWRQLTVERHLMSPPGHEGRQPVESSIYVLCMYSFIYNEVRTIVFIIYNIIYNKDHKRVQIENR